MFLLSSENVFNYLGGRNLCDRDSYDRQKVELKPAKNFNLLLTLNSDRQLLVKQERRDRDGKTAGEFLREWRIQETLNEFNQLASVRHLFPEVLDFDSENSIITFNYLQDYCDLTEFYHKKQIYPATIGTHLGSSVAKIHRLTFNRLEYRDFLASLEGKESSIDRETIAHLEQVDRITPEIFGIYPADGLKFFALYQRYDSLGKAIASLTASYQPCCLVHNDLKLNNILLHDDWKEKATIDASILRFIDWERSNWGDPAFDVGSLIASYAHIWLASLVVSKDISLEDSLRMAVTPLEALQPSLHGLISAYLRVFPEILQHQPTFLTRVRFVPTKSSQEEGCRASVK